MINYALIINGSSLFIVDCDISRYSMTETLDSHELWQLELELLMFYTVCNNEFNQIFLVD